MKTSGSITAATDSSSASELDPLTVPADFARDFRRFYLLAAELLRHADPAIHRQSPDQAIDYLAATPVPPPSPSAKEASRFDPRSTRRFPVKHQTARPPQRPAKTATAILPNEKAVRHGGEVLDGANYFTAMVGKWHVGFPDGVTPANRGLKPGDPAS